MLKKELQKLLNKHSKENDSNTPDFILTEYLMNCLEIYEKTVNAREKWHKGKKWYNKELEKQKN